MREADLQQAIIDLAGMLGWLVYHTHDSRRSREGFPDLVLVRERVIWAELKSVTGVVSAAQKEWIDRLGGLDEEVYVWRPRDWPGAIVDILRRREP